MARRLGFIILLVGILANVALAQSGGQLWVRSYEDRNGNGVRDAGEPLLTRGVSVDLLNADGIVIASALLSESPNAAQGLVGFQMLDPGQYSVRVSSPDYDATAGNEFTTTVNDSGVPPVIEFGATPIEVAPVATADDDADASRPLLAIGAALVVMLIMALIGVMIYLLFFRPRLKQAQQLDRRTTTGSMRPVTGEYAMPRGTGQYPRQTGTGEFERTGTGEFQRPGTAPVIPERPAPVVDEYDFPLDPEDTPRP